jgi:hypothetical protein
MRKFSGSHHSDALYQGTTLVQSCRVTKDLGFQPSGIPALKSETWGILEPGSVGLVPQGRLNLAQDASPGWI